MKKSEKIRTGTIGKVEKTDKQQEEGVFKTREYEANPKISPEYYVKHKHKDGIMVYLYGFDSYARATSAWYEIVNSMAYKTL